MTSANLPINLETTPLFKDYISNVKKQLVKTKRQATRLQVARKSTNWIPNLSCGVGLRLSYIPSYSTAKSTTPVISEATGNSKSILSSNCERENGKEDEPDGKNGEKERARSDGTDFPVDDNHDIQATSDSQLDNQHSQKDVTDGEEKEKEEEDEKTCQASENENMIAKSIKIQEEYVSVLTPNLDIYPDNAVAEENDGSQANMLLDVENKNTNLNSVEQQEEKTKSEGDENSMEIEEPDSNILTTNLDNATAAKDDKTCHVKYNSIVYGCPYSPCDYTTKRRTDVIRHYNRRYTRPPACKFRRQVEPKRKGEWARAKKIPVQKNNLNIEV